MSAPAAVELCEFELQLLRSMCGLEPAIPWGAAVGAALETLKGMRLVHRPSLCWIPTAEGERLAWAAEVTR